MLLRLRINPWLIPVLAELVGDLPGGGGATLREWDFSELSEVSAAAEIVQVLALPPELGTNLQVAVDGDGFFVTLPGGSSRSGFVSLGDAIGAGEKSYFWAKLASDDGASSASMAVIIGSLTMPPAVSVWLKYSPGVGLVNDLSTVGGGVTVLDAAFGKYDTLLIHADQAANAVKVRTANGLYTINPGTPLAAGMRLVGFVSGNDAAGPKVVLARMTAADDMGSGLTPEAGFAAASGTQMAVILPDDAAAGDLLYLKEGTSGVYKGRHYGADGGMPDGAIVISPEAGVVIPLRNSRYFSTENKPGTGSVLNQSTVAGETLTQALNQLATLLAGKLDSSLFNEHYKGTYVSSAALAAAHPAASVGDWAVVDAGSGASPRQWLWDGDSNAWRAGSDVAPASTTVLPEGTNRYFTDERAVAAVQSLIDALEAQFTDVWDQISTAQADIIDIETLLYPLFGSPIPGLSTEVFSAVRYYAIAADDSAPNFTGADLVTAVTDHPNFKTFYSYHGTHEGLTDCPVADDVRWMCEIETVSAGPTAGWQLKKYTLTTEDGEIYTKVRKAVWSGFPAGYNNDSGWKQMAVVP